MSKSARWCFTVNNPGPWLPVFDDTAMDYIVFQHEVGAAGATPHIQGYVRFKIRKALSAAKALIADTAHMEIARGSEEQNRAYCTKADTRMPDTEFHEAGHYDGTKGQQGSRTDIAAVATALAQGQSLKTVALQNPAVFMKYPSGMQALSLLAQSPPLIRDVHVTVLWGPTGTGKSHRAMTSFPDAYVVRYSGARSPWDQYNNETTVIFEEFDPADVPPHQLNSLLDKWKLTLPCRYNNKFAYYTHVIILTNVDPAHWYPMFPQLQRDALLRRLQAPVGQVFNVIDQHSVIDLTWWQAAAAPAAAQAAPPATPVLDGSQSPDEPPLVRHHATLGQQGWSAASPIFVDDAQDAFL